MSESVVKNVMKEIKKSYPLESIDYANMSEEKAQKLQKKIDAKIQSGAKLTPEEMAYLEKTNPQLYLHVKRVQNMREALVRSLKNCKSKQSVEKVYSDAMGSISKNDPDKEYIITCYEKAMAEFKASGEYNNLPETTKEEEETEKDKKKQRVEAGETTDKEKFDLLSYLALEPSFEAKS